MRSGIACVALLFPLVYSLAQTQVTRAKMEIAGTVKDSTGAVVPNGDVQLLSRDGNNLASTSSNEEGAFHFSIPKLDEAVVQIRHKGFKTFVAHVEWSSGRVKPIAAILEVEDLSQQIDVNVGSEAGQISTEPSENRDAAVVSGNTLERLPIFESGLCRRAL